MLRPHRSSSAFTLLELIVVIVVLAVLAAIAVPTFAKVIEKSSDEATLTSLRAMAREAQALEGFDRNGWDEGDVSGAAADTSAGAPGVYAAGGLVPFDDLVAKRDPAAGEVGYRIAGEGLALSKLSDSGRVCVVGANYSSVDQGSCGPSVATASDSTLGVRLSDPDEVIFPSGTGDTGSTPSSPAPPEEVVALVSPESVTATISGTTVTVEWTAVDGAESYTVSKGRFVAATVPAPATSTTVELSPGETFTFSVSAVRGEEVSSPPTQSNSVTAPLAAPVASAAASTSQLAVTVSWAEVTGASSYTVQYKRSVDAAYSAGGTTSQLSATVSGLAEHTSYDFRVVAASSSTSSTSEVVSATTGGTPATVSTLRTFNNSPTAGRMSWLPVEGATSYRVYRAPQGSTSWTLVYQGAGLVEDSFLSAPDSGGMTTGSTYQYRIVAANSYGDSAPTVPDAYSLVRPMTGDAPLGNLDSVTNLPGKNGFRVTGWNFTPSNALNARGFVVYLNGQHWGQFDASMKSHGDPTNKAAHRPDVLQAYPGVGEYAGFSVDIGGIVNGTYEICVTAINPTHPTGLGCRSVTVTN